MDVLKPHMSLFMLLVSFYKLIYLAATLNEAMKAHFFF